MKEEQVRDVRNDLMKEVEELKKLYWLKLQMFSRRLYGYEVKDMHKELTSTAEQMQKYEKWIRLLEG